MKITPVKTSILKLAKDIRYTNIKPIKNYNQYIKEYGSYLKNNK